ncbi:MAG: hypothetical protein P8M04_08630 [Akkermansiaceae bacterium]|nr:hypothetical protein [Akkermansiaceae bacterium]
MVPPPMPEDPRDTRQLNLLVVFYYVYMGLQVAGLAFLGLRYFIAQSVIRVIGEFTKSETPSVEKVEAGSFPDGESIPPETEVRSVEVVQSSEVKVNIEDFFLGFKNLFMAFDVISAVFLVVYVVFNFLAARSISQRRGRVFSMVVAGFNCFSFPLGTALGVFTLIVLSRHTVMNSYGLRAG